MIRLPMKLIAAILLISILAAPFTGARLLDTDTKFNTVLRDTQTTNNGVQPIKNAVVSGSNSENNSGNLTSQRTINLGVLLEKETGSGENSGILMADRTMDSKIDQSQRNTETVHGVIRLHHSPGDGRTSRTEKETAAQSLSASFDILPSGSSPGAGHQYTDGHTQKVQMSSTTGGKSKKSTFNKLPSGPSPGVGHSFTDGHVEKIQALPGDQRRSTFNKLPSGPSSGVGHAYTNGHIEETQTRIFAGEQLSTKIEPQSGPSPGAGHEYTDGHTQRVQMSSTTSGKSKKSTFNKLPSGPSPGVGHSFTDGHVEKIQVLPEDQKRSAFNKLPSGPSPGGGHAYTNGHIEKTQTRNFAGEQLSTKIEPQSGPSPGAGHQYTDDQTQRVQMSSITSRKSKKSTFNKLPSGPSPGVGNSFTDGHVEKMQELSEDQKQSAFNKLPSGPSPGGGHAYTNGHIEETQTRIFAGEQLSTKIEPQSGPSPGAGHQYTDSHTQRVQMSSTTSRKSKKSTFNKLPSGPSPGVGHSFTDGHVEKIQALSEDQKRTAFNKLPSGPSPGAGHAFTNGHIEKTQTRIFAGERLNTKIEPQSGPSPGAGHMQINSANERNTASVVKTEAAYSGPSNGVGHSIPTAVEGKFNSDRPVGHSFSTWETIGNKAFSGPGDRTGHSTIANLQKNKLKATREQKQDMISLRGSDPSERIGCALQGEDQFSQNPQLFAASNFYGSADTTTSNF